jgi:hypothetical protein
LHGPHTTGLLLSQKETYSPSFNIFLPQEK